MLKDLDQFDRQLENTINTINIISTGTVKGLHSVTIFLTNDLLFFFSPEPSLFVHFS